MTGKPYRLPESAGAGRVIDRTKSVSFTFDGKKMSGFAGDTVASAVMASGQRLFGRSFKYHRPRGIIGLGSEEPNALVGVGEGTRHEPNLRATQVELYDGLTAVSQNRWPNLNYDIGAVNNRLSRLFPGGFYYKTFMWPQSFWKSVYEPIIRNAAGLGKAPTGADPDSYEHLHVHCDVLVVGAGVAGLAAAEAAAATGARVIIADENARFGGLHDIAGGKISGKPQTDWVAARVQKFAEADNVHVLTRATVAGHFLHNYVLMFERVADHDPALLAAGAPRHRLWKVRANQIVVATGALERPIAFANNDRPGVMLASAARGLVERHGVAPGLMGVVFTNNDDAYRTALRLKAAGVGIARIIDVRSSPDGALVEAARNAGLDVMAGHAIAGVETDMGGRSIDAVKVAPYSAGQGRVVNETRIDCDFVTMSGGWNPVVHMWCHEGGKLKFDTDLQAFVPDQHNAAMHVAGSANGQMSVGACLEDGYGAGERAAKAARPKSRSARVRIAKTDQEAENPLQPIWFSPATGKYNEGNKHFIDFQNDVTAADLELAQREGYESIEHTKRYTTLGMATDQGKTSNINALGVLSQATGRDIPDIGTTTFRPPYTPISMGSIAGTASGKLFHPVRKTPIYGWHQAQGADFEPVGDWRRPYCYPKKDEGRRDAVNREIMFVRDGVGLLDASTLGKIEIKGPDAAALLDRIYTNMFSNLKIGKGRYGLMMDELGFLMDDGVTVRLADDHFLMHTTSGGSDKIVAWLEEWLQTEWMDLKVFVTPVTEQWAQFAVAGPKARDVLEAMDGDVDLSADGLSFMSMTEGKLGGYPVRIFRISFSGELSYEVATPANFGRGLWDALLLAGVPHGIKAYGTEALHVLRAEKGFIVVGDETDGTVTPLDVGLNWAVSKKKPDYIGKRSLEQPFLKSEGRKQLVGLLTEDPNEVLPDGAYAVEVIKDKPPMKTIGHVTSTYWSPTLERSIAMALVDNGQNRTGEMLSFPLQDKVVKAEIVDPVFYDKQGERQNV